jgi:F-type H+-transporting ATPase subunit epsilon
VYEKTFHLEIITPQKIVYRGDATSVSAPGVKGGFQVLYNHAPLLSEFAVGKLTVKDSSGSDRVFATSGGFVEVNSNQVVVLADTAESPGDIDVERAKAAMERASHRLRDRAEGLDVERARSAVFRAVNRLRVAQLQ